MRYGVLFLLITGCVSGIPEESGKIDVFFCDQVDCLMVFEEFAAGKDVSCAMYHATNAFTSVVGMNLVVDGSYPVKNAIVESGDGLMHNKFCVIDNNTVWTGSWNPNQGMGVPNNVVVVESETIARMYQNEFDELYEGMFHGGASRPGLVLLNGNLVEAYFCPEDNCQEHVMEVLAQAEESIHFMTFSFTDDDIGSVIRMMRNKGVEVKGVFDPRKSKYSEFESLSDVSVVKKVHHKVFIIDGEIVITGSYNPSRNGNERNDENVIIIHDSEVAQLFENEFVRLFD